MSASDETSGGGQPYRYLREMPTTVKGVRVIVVGTNHTWASSVEAVKDTIQKWHPSCVVLELCAWRSQLFFSGSLSQPAGSGEGVAPRSQSPHSVETPLVLLGDRVDRSWPGFRALAYVACAQLLARAYVDEMAGDELQSNTSPRPGSSMRTSGPGPHETHGEEPALPQLPDLPLVDHDVDKIRHPSFASKESSDGGGGVGTASASTSGSETQLEAGSTSRAVQLVGEEFVEAMIGARRIGARLVAGDRNQWTTIARGFLSADATSTKDLPTIAPPLVVFKVCVGLLLRNHAMVGAAVRTYLDDSEAARREEMGDPQRFAYTNAMAIAWAEVVESGCTSMTESQYQAIRKEEMAVETDADTLIPHAALRRALVEERNEILAHSLHKAACEVAASYERELLDLTDQEREASKPPTVVGVVGLGHLDGIEKYWGLTTDDGIKPLLQMPENYELQAYGSVAAVGVGATVGLWRVWRRSRVGAIAAAVGVPFLMFGTVGLLLARGSELSANMGRTYRAAKHQYGTSK